MADIDDSHALFPQFVDDGEKGLHLCGGQGRGGLVQDQHLAVRRHGLGDLHQLHLGDAEGAQLSLGIKVQMHFLQHRLRVLVHLLVIHSDDGPHPLGRIAAYVNIFADAPFRNGLEFLVNHGNAPVQRVQGAFDLDLLPLVDNLTLVHVINAEHTLHQRGFTCAVLSHQRMHSTGAEVELRVIQRLDTGEGLDDITHFQTIF